MTSKILRLDKEKYELWLSYTWSNNNHGICGHTFEVVDYYLLLRKHFKLGILLAEDINWETFKASILSKYDLEDEILEEIKLNTVFSNRPILVAGSNILFTDGGIRSLHDKTLIFKNIFHFACGDIEIKENKKENVFILQDDRVYDKCFNGINYKKKIFFKYYKEIESKSSDNLLYGTKNCRNLTRDQYNDILSKYDGDFVCLTSEENRLDGLDKRIKFHEMPVEDLFEKFETYIYTPVPRKFDCSPRFIAECKFYNKKVIFHDIDYWDEDRGLYWRNWDVENDFDSICLKEDDSLIEILKAKI